MRSQFSGRYLRKQKCILYSHKYEIQYGRRTEHKFENISSRAARTDCYALFWALYTTSKNILGLREYTHDDRDGSSGRADMTGRIKDKCNPGRGETHKPGF
jgi:hypothetical protein